MNLFLKIYQIWLSPYLGGNCRFYPSCSEYAEQAIHHLSPDKALIKILSRLSKCRPGGPSGFDPLLNNSPQFGEQFDIAK